MRGVLKELCKFTWQRKTIKVRVQQVSKFSFGSPLDFSGSINQTTHTFSFAGISTSWKQTSWRLKNTTLVLNMGSTSGKLIWLVVRTAFQAIPFGQAQYCFNLRPFNYSKMPLAACLVQPLGDFRTSRPFNLYLQNISVDTWTCGGCNKVVVFITSPFRWKRNRGIAMRN